jgi:SagB-type dehydrogenase family enzyme
MSALPFLLAVAVVADPAGAAVEQGEVIELPAPRRSSSTSVEEALESRRSIRSWARAAPSLADVSQLLWAAQGITGSRGRRTAPSAGATFPLELFLVAGQVEDLPAGVYRYRPAHHQLARVAEGDRRRALSEAALGQEWVESAPASLVVTAVVARTAGRYGRRAERYVPIEVGHVGQSVYLQAEALGLGVVEVGAFDDERVREVVEAADERPYAILAFGLRR